MVFQAARRIAQLDAAHEGLVFGRLDMRDERGPGAAVHRPDRAARRRPRLAADRLAGAGGRRVLPGHRGRAARRRTPPGAALHRPDASSGSRTSSSTPVRWSRETDLPIVGEGALMAQLSRARDRSMHSIVATIQAEQDLAIRAPGKGVVSISGGPGTGKTVVALHRAAYLLYTDRRRYEGGGVLIVGPSGVFMRYIERVLPVARRDRGGAALAGRGRRRRQGEPPRRARGRGREGLGPDGHGAAPASRGMQAPGSPSGFRVFWRDDVIVLDRGVLGRVRRSADVAGPPQPSAAAGRGRAARAMWRQVRGERGRERGREAFDDEMLSDQDFLDFVLAWWPPLEAADVLGWLRDPDVLAPDGRGRAELRGAAAAAQVLGWSASEAAIVPSVEDVPLLDELRYALGDVPARTDDERDLDETGLLEGGHDMQELLTAADREYAPSGRSWAPPTHRIEDDPYAHVLVDEAQDLTPMQWRMVGRRGRSRVLDDRRRPGAVVVADARRVRGRPRRGARGQGPSTSSTCRPTTATARRSTSTPRRTRSASGSTPTCRPRSAPPASRRRRSRASPTSRPRPARRCSRSLGRSAAPSPSSSPSPGAPRSTPGWRPGPSSPTTPRAPVRRSTRRSRRPGRTGSSCSPASTPRAWSSTRIVVVRPDEIEAESATGRATLYVVLTRATRLLTTRQLRPSVSSRRVSRR